MKAIITNYRYWVLFVLGTIAIIGLVAIPQDGIGFLPYLAVLFGTKLVAFTAFAVFFILYLYWQDNDKIPELTKLASEE